MATYIRRLFTPASAGEKTGRYKAGDSAAVQGVRLDAPSSAAQPQAPVHEVLHVKMMHYAENVVRKGAIHEIRVLSNEREAAESCNWDKLRLDETELLTFYEKLVLDICYSQFRIFTFIRLVQSNKDRRFLFLEEGLPKDVDHRYTGVDYFNTKNPAFSFKERPFTLADVVRSCSSKPANVPDDDSLFRLSAEHHSRGIADVPPSVFSEVPPLLKRALFVLGGATVAFALGYTKRLFSSFTRRETFYAIFENIKQTEKMLLTERDPSKRLELQKDSTNLRMDTRERFTVSRVNSFLATPSRKPFTVVIFYGSAHDFSDKFDPAICAFRALDFAAPMRELNQWGSHEKYYERRLAELSASRRKLQESGAPEGREPTAQEQIAMYRAVQAELQRRADAEEAADGPQQQESGAPVGSEPTAQEQGALNKAVLAEEKKATDAAVSARPSMRGVFRGDGSSAHGLGSVRQCRQKDIWM